MISARTGFGLLLIIHKFHFVSTFFTLGASYAIFSHRLPRSLLDVLEYAFTRRIVAATHGILDS